MSNRSDELENKAAIAEDDDGRLQERRKQFEAEQLTEDLVFHRFGQGICCGAQVFGALAEDAGIDGDTARRIAAGFGSGMTCAGTCGCVTGSLMALGCRYGNFLPEQMERRSDFFEKRREFLKEFEARFGSTNCPKIVQGYDPSDPEDLEVIRSQLLMRKICAPMVLASIGIAEALMR